MQYPAVIIPTLCRYEHFHKCLESLRHCTHADKVDVFIGLDYPAKKSHWPGYNKIVEYLSTVSGFHSLNVLKREVNYGSTRNAEDARLVASQHHESYVYLEDDNEVAPNFLDYICKGLERFKDTPNVIAVSGYSYRNDFPCGKSNFYLQRSGFNVWGYAIHFDKRERMLSQLTRWYSIKKILNPICLIHTAWYSWSSLLFLLMHAIKPSLHSDYVLSNFLLFENLNMVMPSKTLLRNNGFDGSGEHCGTVEGFADVELGDETTFDFVGDGMDNYWEIDHQLHLSKRSAMPFTRMCRHIYEMTRVHVFKLPQR